MSVTARRSRRPSNSSRKFRGVRDSGRSGHPWFTEVMIDGSSLRLGTWKTAREAAEAYDRVVLYHRGKGARRNFPDTRLTPASADTLKAEARRRFKQRTTSRYRGVKQARGSWRAQMIREGNRLDLGHWATEREAAEAHDRATRFLTDDEAYLNFPRRRLQALSPAEIRRLAHLAHKKATTTSRYLGVRFVRKRKTRPWTVTASFGPATQSHFGNWATEKDAATAYDRAARFYLGTDAELNFPGRKLVPADAATLIAKARKEEKLTQRRARDAVSNEPQSATQQWRYNLTKIAAGLCTLCNRPLVTSKYCREHAIRENRRRHEGRFNHCGMCGALAHNRLTCPKRRRR